MTQPIQVERDAEGLRMALRALFEENFERERLTPQAAEMPPQDAEEYLQREMPPRELSPGYYVRASYLLDLARSIEVGCHYDACSLTHADVEGLQALKAARNEFERDHPPCPRCGTRLFSPFVAQCHACQQKISRAA